MESSYQETFNKVKAYMIDKKVGLDEAIKKTGVVRSTFYRKVDKNERKNILLAPSKAPVKNQPKTVKKTLTRDAHLEIKVTPGEKPSETELVAPIVNGKVGTFEKTTDFNQSDQGLKEIKKGRLETSSGIILDIDSTLDEITKSADDLKAQQSNNDNHKVFGDYEVDDTADLDEPNDSEDPPVIEIVNEEEQNSTVLAELVLDAHDFGVPIITIWFYKKHIFKPGEFERVDLVQKKMSASARKNEKPNLTDPELDLLDKLDRYAEIEKGAELTKTEKKLLFKAWKGQFIKMGVDEMDLPIGNMFMAYAKILGSRVVPYGIDKAKSII